MDSNAKHQTYTKDEFLTRVRKDIPDAFTMIPAADTLSFELQSHITHTKASGARLRIGTIIDKDNGVETTIWALLVWDEGVCFVREGGEKMSARALKHARLDEPMRTIAGAMADGRAAYLRSMVWAWFMDKAFVHEFRESSIVRLKSFQSGCKRLAQAMRDGHYDIGNSEKPWEEPTQKKDEKQKARNDGVKDATGDDIEEMEGMEYEMCIRGGSHG